MVSALSECRQTWVKGHPGAATPLFVRHPLGGSNVSGTSLGRNCLEGRRIESSDAICQFWSVPQGSKILALAAL